MPQIESVAVPKRFPLVIQPENRSETTDKDARLINAFVEKGRTEGEYFVNKRPGLSTIATLSGNGLGCFNWLGDVYAVFGTTLYKNQVAVAGTVDSTGGMYRFTSCLGDTPKMQFGNGVATYNYDTTNGIVAISATQTITAGSFVVGISYTILTVGTTDFTLIGAASNTIGVVFTASGAGVGTGTATTATNFPSATVKGIVYLDGTTYVMTSSASIRGDTTINTPTSWTDLLNRIDAQIEPDGGVGLAKQLVYVLALGQWSTEVFYDQANATASPLGPVQGAKINYGCANVDSVQEIDGILFWISTNRGAAAQILMLDNLRATIVSTKPIERILGEADLSSVRSFGIKYEGHRFYGITLIAANITLVYDFEDGMWAQWTDASGNYWPIVGSTFSTTYGRILQHATNGKLYQFDSTYYTDDSSLITVDLYTPNFDGGVRRRKQLNMVEFIADQVAGSNLQVRHNDSDYDPTKWTNFRTVSLGNKKPILMNNGTFMRRAYHLRHKANTRFRIMAMEMQLDLGTL